MNQQWISLLLLATLSQQAPTEGGFRQFFHVFGIQLPVEIDSEELVISSPWPPSQSISALFWGSWTVWDNCSVLVNCSYHLPDSSILTKRSRTCLRRTLREEELVDTDGQDGQYQHSNRTPCMKENQVEVQTDLCDFNSFCDTQDNTTEAPSLTTEYTKATPVFIVTRPRKIKNTVLGRWGAWKPFQKCRPLIIEVDVMDEPYAWESLLATTGRPVGQRCEPGIELQRRQCQVPFGSALDVPVTCVSSLDSSLSQAWKPEYTTVNRQEDIRQVHCWINEACPSGDLATPRPPENCVFTAVLHHSVVQIQWHRSPYGGKPRHFQIFAMQLEPLAYEEAAKSAKYTVDMLPPDAWGEMYQYNVSDLRVRQAYKFRIGSVHSDESVVLSEECEAIVIVGSGDGAWSKWSMWSHCSSQCASTVGQRVRTRKCNSPEPQESGRQCPGNMKMLIKCLGNDISC